ncbi:MAG: efflux RND transporter periplasmic adaptor subunit [Phycisphaeraceae bacterium]
MNTPRTMFLISVLLAAFGLSVLTGCDSAADAAPEPSATQNEHGHEHADHEDDGHAQAQTPDEHAGHDHGEPEHADDHEGDAHHDHGHDEAAHADEVRLTPEAIERYGIELDTAQRTVPSATLTAPARIGFNTERLAHVGSLVEGRVMEIAARLGDRVEAGDTLFVLDSPELGRLQSAYLSHRTTVAASEPMVAFAKTAHERAMRLYEDGAGVSLAEAQRRERELAEARRDLRTAEAELAAAENALRLHGMSDEQVDQLAESGQIDPRSTITAPIAGEVIEREATLGELVSPNNERLMLLADLSQVWALVDVAESKLAQVGIGTPVTLEVSAVPGRALEGEVTYIGPRIDERARTARLRVELENADRLLRPGMFARATLVIGSGGERVLAVPAASVMEVEGEPSIFVPVPGEENTFARRAVVVGDHMGNFVPVLSGLDEGDRVVTHGVFILKADLGKAGAEHVH